MKRLNLLNKIVLGILSFNLGLLNPIYTRAESAENAIKESPQAVPGEFIVKLKPGAELSAIQELNAFYKVTSAQELFSQTIEPKERLARLKNELTGLDNSHQSWYWQLDKDSKEYKDYVARIEREKEGLNQKIKAEEEFIADLEERQARAGEEITTPDLNNVYLLKTDSLAGVPAIALAYEANAMVEYAEPNYIFKAQWSPNDPYYDADNAWGLKIIKAESAWDVSKGNDIVVAVVDSGVNYNHADLKNNIWSNSRETAADGLDNDGNGYIDDVKGWDFAASDAQADEVEEDNDPADEYGHGTAIAGIIAAEGNNSQGIVGVAPKAKVMAVKALDNGGFGSASVLAQAIRYAADNGAKVINNSWGNEDDERRYSCSINDAIEYAQSKGCIVVSSAGNQNTDARYYSPDNSSGMIVVAAIDEDGQTRWRPSDNEGSNYGSRVDLSAPASGLSLSADSNSGYSSNVSGTSISAAYVSGAAALLLKKFPDDSRNEIKARLMSSATAFTTNYSASDTLMGSGVLNAYAALTNAKSPLFALENVEISEKSGGDKDGIIESNEKTELLVTLRNIGKDASSVKMTLTTTSVDVTINENRSGAEFGPVKYNKTSTVSFSFTPSDVTTGRPMSQAFTINIEADDVSQEIDFRVWTGARNLNVTARSPYISTYEDKIVYMDDRSDNYDIYMYDLGEDKETRLTDNSSDQKHPFIHGNKVVYKDNRNGNWDIYLYNLDTKKETQITSDSKNQYYPSIYDDKIAYLHEVSESNFQLKVYDLDKKTTEICADDVYGSVPPYIYDNKVAAVAYANEEIWLENVGDDSGTRVAEALSGNNFRNGLGVFKNKVVYSEDTSGSYDIYLYDIEQKSRKTIASTGQDERYSFVYGDRIAYTRDNKSTSNNIYVYDTGVEGTDYDGYKERQIATFNRIARPHLSGTKVIWTSLDDWGLKQQIYLTELEDKSPPSKPKVTVNKYTTSKSEIKGVKFESNDYESGIKEYTYQLWTSDGTEFLLNSEGENRITTKSSSVDISGFSLEEGQSYAILVKATNDNNVSSDYSESDDITVDSAAPDVSKVEDDGSSTIDNSKLKIKVSSSSSSSALDAVSGVKEYSITAAEKDAKGITKNYSLTKTASSGKTLASETIEIKPGDLESGKTSFKKGYTYTFKLKAKDNAGNESAEKQTDGITVSDGSSTDTTAPSVTINAVSKGAATKVWSASLKVTEAESEVTYYSYCVSKNSSAPSWTDSGKWRTVKVKSKNGIELGKDKKIKNDFGLELKKKTTYYLYLKAKNKANLWSDTASKSFNISDSQSSEASVLANSAIQETTQLVADIPSNDKNVAINNVALGSQRAENPRDSDATAPTMPTVADEGKFTAKKNRISASWASEDKESGIAEYQYKITIDSSSGTMVKDWTSAGTDKSVTLKSLDLANGKTYYFSVKARNGAGLWSETGYSDGIMVDSKNPSIKDKTKKNQEDKQRLLFQAKVSDDYSGIKRVKLKTQLVEPYPYGVDEDGWQEYDMEYNSAEGFYQKRITPHKIRPIMAYHIIAKDNAGNVMETERYFVQIDDI